MKSVNDKCLGEGETFFYQERLDKMREKYCTEIYIENTKLDGSRGVKRYRTLIFAR